jgi:hypothetical protein
VELDRLYPNRDQDPQEQTDFENDCSLLTQPFVAVLLLQTHLARLRRARAEAQLQLDAATPLARRYIAIVSDLERQKDSVTARTDELVGKRRYGPTIDLPPGVTLEQLNTLEEEVQALLEDYRHQLDQLKRVAIIIHREEIKIETDLDFIISGCLRIIDNPKIFPGRSRLHPPSSTILSTCSAAGASSLPIRRLAAGIKLRICGSFFLKNSGPILV